MAEHVIATRIKQLRDTEDNFESINPVLLLGELAVVEDRRGYIRFKVGNGAAPFTELNYADPPSITLSRIDEICGGAVPAAEDGEF